MSASAKPYIGRTGAEFASAGLLLAALAAATLPLGLRLLATAGPVLLLLSVAAGAWCLAGLVRSVRAGQPFDRRNPARLVGVALAVLAGGVLAPVVRDLAGIAVLDSTGLVGPGSPFAVAATLRGMV